ncbi:hypothetical protein M2132_002171 [Dysgonomonas sp. PH5-45]|uniref:DUF6051 family protein n=1 Tax=unclassified Dysgonomonas TaxID=2630389 RepID=UPI002473A759|nr:MULTISPECIES: DUF6051 family protein [unclassified Dysgonomonas]MDH6355824.1 hypothetical protein [Dysgonomonas sp. PH5-45]MDH6388709.1 hypothetical protein [Dysgonomonas sp. PH5-37]
MKYLETYNHFKSIENYNNEVIDVDADTVMRNYSFESKYRFLLPGGDENKDGYEYTPSDVSDVEYEPDIIQEMLDKTDAEILENLEFRYHTLSPKGQPKAKGIILMFHGFNEKYWIKYLPWAKYLLEKTGKTIVMFPIAFHMNRAPAAWSDTREMYNISQQRKERHPNVICSSLSNVAISTRLHNKPQRFIWSGLQAYYDVIDLVKHIKAGQHPHIEADASIDLFSYSIGSLLSEILMMTNQNGYFSDSQFVSYCGGAVFNRLSPVSKFILDSEANVSLYSYVVEHIESHMKRDKLLAKYLSESYPEGINFRSMLDYKVFTHYREEKFRAMAHRIYAITLASDSIVPAYEVINTLQGSCRDIPIRVDVLDYDYKYKHEDPFPAIKNMEDKVDAAFRQTFDLISDFFR